MPKNSGTPVAVPLPKVRLMILDPGHFHAALIQKNMYDQIDPVVYVFAPDGPDVRDYLKHTEAFNSRPVKPTQWEQNIYLGPDFMDRMIKEKPGNVVVVAGNNAMKTNYILPSVRAGLHVLADKPMAIKAADFPVLTEAFKLAETNKVLLYDIMTERYEIATILQKELANVKDVFGELMQGTPQQPAVEKKSVHHFFKYVAGHPIRRPAWAFDVEQQGEGIVDVSTHLIDLVFWECFPEAGIDYEKDIEVISARRWDTMLTNEQFRKVTHQSDYPEYLMKYVQDQILNVSANGEIAFRVKNVYAKITVIWNYETPGGDTHYSMMRGTRSNLVIRQGEEEEYIPTLYVEPGESVNPVEFRTNMMKAIALNEPRFPGISLRSYSNGWQVVVPEKYRIGHEAHFAQVTEKYLEYLKWGSLPDWEVSNMLAKYYVTTKAFEMSRSIVDG